jgi:hypothetical protein
MTDDDPLAEGSDADSTDDESDGLLSKAKEGLETTGGRTGSAIVASIRWIGDRLLKNTLGLVYALTKLLPVFGERFWKKLALRTMYLYHQRAGGDALGVEALTQEKADLTPVKYKPAEQTEQEERPGWSAKNRDKVWSPTTFGRSTMRLGKVPIIPLDNDSWQATSYAEARVAEAVDQGDTRPLYDVSDAELTATFDATGAGGAGQQAVADGGTNVQNMEFNPRSTAPFKDMIVEIGGDDYDGQAISFWKTKELMLETTTTEEMERQEERGFLAGRSRDDLKSWALKIMLIGAALGLAGLVGPELVNAVFGGGGGGGGGGGAGIIPFQLSVR